MEKIIRAIGIVLIRNGLTFFFNSLDKDKDGKVDEKELKEFINIIFSKLGDKLDKNISLSIRK